MGIFQPVVITSEQDRRAGELYFKIYCRKSSLLFFSAEVEAEASVLVFGKTGLTVDRDTGFQFKAALSPTSSLTKFRLRLQETTAEELLVFSVVDWELLLCLDGTAWKT